MTAQQIVQAFPEDTAPRYLLRDRDEIYGARYRQRVGNLGIEEVLTAPRSPWQRMSDDAAGIGRPGARRYERELAELGS